jgi:hypothetical protein
MPVNPFEANAGGISSLLVHCRSCSWFVTVTAQSLKAVRNHIIYLYRSLRTPEDVAGSAFYLASRAGAFVNGATIVLDGGLLVDMQIVNAPYPLEHTMSDLETRPNNNTNNPRLHSVGATSVFRLLSVSVS